jgi:hypothetical protein
MFGCAPNISMNGRRNVLRSNPQLAAIALLVRKFGEKIAGGGYEVRVKASELTSMSPHGTFQEIPGTDEVRWQYFPNNTIDAEPGSWKDVTPESVTEKSDGTKQLRNSSGSGPEGK